MVLTSTVLIFLKMLKNKDLILLSSTDIYFEYSSAHTKCYEFTSTLLW